MSLKSVFDSFSSLFIPLNDGQPSSQRPETELKEVEEAKESEYTVPGTRVRLLDSAVLLVPCAHTMPQVSAQRQFGPMNGQYCALQGIECPHCVQKVTGYLPDHKMRSLFRIVPQIHSGGHTDKAEVEKALEKMKKEVTCPVELEPLGEGVALIPCAHRVNQAAAVQMYGAMDGEFCTNQAKPCPECRTLVSGYIADPSIRELSKLSTTISLDTLPLMRLVEFGEETNPLSEKARKSLQRALALSLARANELSASLTEKVQTIRERSSQAISKWSEEISERRKQISRDLGDFFLSLRSTPVEENQTGILPLTVEKAIEMLASHPRSGQFRSCAETLLSIIDRRNLIGSGRREIGDVDDVFSREDMEEFLADEEALEEYLSAFRRLCTHMNVSIEDSYFPIFAIAACEFLRHISSRRDYGMSRGFAIKLDTTIQAIHIKIFQRIVKDFARRPLGDITVEKFKKTVLALKYIFPNNSIDALAFELRRAIFNEHRRNLSDFSITLIAAADINSDLFREIKRAHGFALRDMEVQLTVERLFLAGRDWDHRGDGLLDQAYQAMERARAALTIAENEKNTARAESIRQISVTSSDDDTEGFEGTPAFQLFRDRFRVFKEAKVAFEAAQRAFNELKNRYEEIISRLSQVRDQIANLDAMVAAEIRRNAELLSELAIDPSSMHFNPSARAASLRTIVGY